MTDWIKSLLLTMSQAPRGFLDFCVAMDEDIFMVFGLFFFVFAVHHDNISKSATVVIGYFVRLYRFFSGIVEKIISTTQCLALQTLATIKYTVIVPAFQWSTGTFNTAYAYLNDFLNTAILPFAHRVVDLVNIGCTHIIVLVSAGYNRASDLVNSARNHAVILSHFSHDYAVNLLHTITIHLQTLSNDDRRMQALFIVYMMTVATLYMLSTFYYWLTFHSTLSDEEVTYIFKTYLAALSGFTVLAVFVALGLAKLLESVAARIPFVVKHIQQIVNGCHNFAGGIIWDEVSRVQSFRDSEDGLPDSERLFAMHVQEQEQEQAAPCTPTPCTFAPSTSPWSDNLSFQPPTDILYPNEHNSYDDESMLQTHIAEPSNPIASKPLEVEAEVPSAVLG